MSLSNVSQTLKPLGSYAPLSITDEILVDQQVIPTTRVDDPKAPQDSNSLAHVESIQSRADIPINESDLQFIPYPEWDSSAIYNGVPLRHAIFSLEWSVKINKRTAATNTEQDLVLEPEHFWKHFLKSNLQTLIDELQRENGPLHPASVDIQASVLGHQERPMKKRFERQDAIAWNKLRSQLLQWSRHLLNGAKLWLDIGFNYTRSQSKRGSKKDVPQLPHVSCPNVTSRSMPKAQHLASHLYGRESIRSCDVLGRVILDRTAGKITKLESTTP